MHERSSSDDDKAPRVTPRDKKSATSAPPAALTDAESPIDLPMRLAFLQLTDDDRQRLQSIAGTLIAAGPEFVEQFYRHLFRFEETARFLDNPELVARLKQLQQSHLESMLTAPWDESYVLRRQRVGDVHAQVGIKPEMFLGAYNQYLQFCFQRLLPTDNAPAEAFAANVLALLKVVLLDIGLTLDAYFVQATRNIRQALELVFRSNAELRQFAQFTSHDLKTLLATVANLCDEALDEFGDSLPGEARGLIEAARKRAFAMSATIDELLSSTISLGHEGELEEFPVADALAEAIEQVRPQLDEKEIELSISDRLPWVVGDRVRLREAFYNLLTNAAKFIDKQPGRIDIDCRIEDEDCIITVADNGPGIPAEEYVRIFVPFRRLPSHRDRPGSGLGLYFTKNIIEQQGGRVWVESTLGEGSRFSVRLKRAGSDTPDEGQARRG